MAAVPSVLALARTSSLSRKPAAPATTTLNPLPELALSSVSVRRRVPTVVTVVTQFVTQACGAHGSRGGRSSVSRPICEQSHGKGSLVRVRPMNFLPCGLRSSHHEHRRSVAPNVGARTARRSRHGDARQGDKMNAMNRHRTRMALVLGGVLTAAGGVAVNRVGGSEFATLVRS